MQDGQPYRDGKGDGDFGLSGWLGFRSMKSVGMIQRCV